MYINSLYSISRDIRIGGLATGLDTDSIVGKLVKLEQMKVDKLKQQRQLIEWKKEDYREIINLLRGFKDEFFDVLKPDSYMLSPNAYKTFKVTSSNEDIVTATANADALEGTYTIDSITSLATAAFLKSSDSVSAPLQGTNDLSGGVNLNGKSFVLKVNGTSKTITFDKDYGAGEVDALKQDLQKLIDEIFGSGVVTVDVDGTSGYLKLSPYGDTKSILEVYSGENDALAELGFQSGQSNRIDLDATLESISLNNAINFGDDDKISFTINGVNFTFEKTDTMRDVINTINNSKAGVILSYSSVSDTFTLQAKETGGGNTIKIENDTENFFSAINFGSLVASGRNAEFSLNGKTFVSSTNTFTIDGITYTLKGTTDSPVTLTVEQDVDAAYNKIKAFVDRYNEVIEKINQKLTEKRYRDYPPLTDEQKAQMSEEEIKLWEEKARSGLLRGDLILQNIVDRMREALYSTVTIETVNGTEKISLFEMGITTGSYQENGKLYIDETKLEEALRTKGDQIIKLFTNKSSIDYSPNLSEDERKKWYNETGLMYRIYNVLQDNIRTTRNSLGQKGILIEKAGVEGDITEFNNLMDKELERMDEKIEKAIELLNEREDYYWRQFTALERAIQQMNMQSAWLAQQLGMGTS